MAIAKSETTLQAWSAASPTGDNGWLDYDGKSTVFKLAVGTGTFLQNFLFVPSTSSLVNWLPTPGACNMTLMALLNAANTPGNLDSCAVSRGVETYNSLQSHGYLCNRSSTCASTATNDVLNFGDGSGEPGSKYFGSSYYDAAGTFDLDWLHLTSGSTSVNSTAPVPILGIQSLPYYLPSVGLGFGYYKDSSNNVVPSLLTAMANDSAIPSKSWGYTAGASYRSNGQGQPGSLVLGGYDASRISSQSAQISMGLNAPELSVQVSAINVISSGSGTRNPSGYSGDPFKAIIDSTLPYLFLPEKVCAWFASNFDLQYHTDTGAYTLTNDSLSANILSTQTINFKIQDVNNADEIVTIAFPYDAFNVIAHWQWGFGESTYLFPIQNTSGTAILGRAFLQESYLFANYEVDPPVFNISQVAFPTSTIGQIVTIDSAGSKSVDRHGGGLSTGTKIGIGIGAGLGGIGLILIAALLWFFCLYRPRRNKKRAAEGKLIKEEQEPDSLSPIAAGLSPRTPSHRRRETYDSGWSSNTWGPSESDASSPPGLPLGAHARISELSSESERGRHMSALGALQEMEDKSDATLLEQYEARRKEAAASSAIIPRTPQEMPISHE